MSTTPHSAPPYRGRLAPSPTGYLHVGHARTFWVAQARARERAGTLVLRNEDLDHARCKPAFLESMLEDLRAFGFRWDEGPDCGGPHGPYSQSQRLHRYREAFKSLSAHGFVYPCTCSRQDVLRALQAPHVGDEEPLYPGTCRPSHFSSKECPQTSPKQRHAKVSWRFRVPDGDVIFFTDHNKGPQKFRAGVDFGDFVVWRHDQIPSYQLAVVVDDAAMRITEVVRGEDLLLSTARQLLIYSALGMRPPDFFHCSLVRDEHGARLAKRHDALSLRTLLARGVNPTHLTRSWSQTDDLFADPADPATPGAMS